MHRLLCVVLAVTLADWPAAATAVYMLDTASKLTPPAGWQYKTTGTSAGSGSVGTSATNTVAGPVSGQAWTNCATRCVTQAAGGSPRLWITPPLSSGVTIAGTITPHIYCTESNTNTRASFRYEILHWSKATGGFITSLGISGDSGMAECPTSAGAAITSLTLTPADAWSCAANCHGQTWNVFAAGDRIAIVFYLDDASTGNMVSGRTFSLRYNYTSGSPNYAQTDMSFTETLSFAADSANGRPIGSTN